MTNVVIFLTILLFICSIIAAFIEIILDYKKRKLGIVSPIFKGLKLGKFLHYFLFSLPYILSLLLFIVYPTCIGEFVLIVNIFFIVYIFAYYMHFKIDRLEITFKRTPLIIKFIGVCIAFFVLLLMIVCTKAYLDFRLGPSDIYTQCKAEVCGTQEIRIAESEAILDIGNKITENVATVLYAEDVDGEEAISFYSYDKLYSDYLEEHELKGSEFSLNIVDDATNIEYPYYILTTTLYSYVSEVDPMYKTSKIEMHYDIYVRESDIQRIDG